MTATENLDRSMAGALAWSAGARWISQILSWVSTIIVARLLTPYDYGLVYMAGVYLCLASLISQGGIGEAIVALRDLTSRQIAELNTVAVLLGGVLLGVSSLAAAPVAHFFSAPPLRAVVIVGSSQYILAAPGIVPRALLQKELRFKLLASIDTARAFCQIVVTIILAWLHFGYWSLMLGTLANCAVGATLTVFAKWHGFALPALRNLRRELRFSSHVAVSAIGWYVYDNADFGIAGRMLGEVPLGNYTVAWNIASAPVEKIATLLTVVTPAFFSAVQKSEYHLRRYFLGLTELLSLVTVPASIGLALTANDLVPVLLGSKWQAAIGPLRLLSIFIAVRSVAAILPHLLNMIRDAEFVMWSTIASAVVMPIAFLIGSHWGTDGIAAAWVVAYPPVMSPLYWRVFQKTGTRMKDYASSVMPAVSSSIIMAVVVVLARLESPFRPHSLPDLCFLIVTGMLSYSAALMASYNDRVLRIVRALKRVRQSNAAVENTAPVGLLDSNDWIR